MSVKRYVETLDLHSRLPVPGGENRYVNLRALTERGFPAVAGFPVSIKILLEAALRQEDGDTVGSDHVEALLSYDPARPSPREMAFLPSRVLLQDFTGVPCLVDLAAMRDALARMGGDPSRVNPLRPVDLVVDHSVQVDHFREIDAQVRNEELEFARNRERYNFLRWGQLSFSKFRVFPPSSGICHQVNLEFLGRVVEASDFEGESVAYFDTVVGTDSHTPMINGLGILGWGVGGIEAEGVMLGRPLYLQVPPVMGVRLFGDLKAGVSSTDLVLTLTQLLRAHGVVDKIVEFYGPGLGSMSVPDRATIANMAPEYGATAAYFPLDEATLEYLTATGRSATHIALVRSYAEAQGVFRWDHSPDPDFESRLELDLGAVEPCISGPKRPQDRIPLSRAADAWRSVLAAPVSRGGYGEGEAVRQPYGLEEERGTLGHGDVVIAALTSCTNTSNPRAMLAAGLLAKRAVERGLSVRRHVKTSLAPGSRVVSGYLERAGLMEYLEFLGFRLVGYGCTTCIGNSGPLPEPISRAVEDGSLVVAAVLSGNRNFEGRINPHTKANYLMSPALVVAYALAGSMSVDLEREPLGSDRDGHPVYLRDIWPGDAEISGLERSCLGPEAFREAYNNLEFSNGFWNSLGAEGSSRYPWVADSTYLREPNFFHDMPILPPPLGPILGARCLVLAGDSITTDHISPAGDIAPGSPAGIYLQTCGVSPQDFNSYGSRRGNHEVMVRGTFANIRFRNLLVPGGEGSQTVFHGDGSIMDIHTASLAYRKLGVPLVVLAGADYGMGSSRDWAAKGTALLGVQVVIAVSFERIHRSNLVGMGVLPLEFLPGENCGTLGLTGKESFDIFFGEDLRPGGAVTVVATNSGGTTKNIRTLCRIAGEIELEYYRHGGILRKILRDFVK